MSLDFTKPSLNIVDSSSFASSFIKSGKPIGLASQEVELMELSLDYVFQEHQGSLGARFDQVYHFLIQLYWLMSS